MGEIEGWERGMDGEMITHTDVGGPGMIVLASRRLKVIARRTCLGMEEQKLICNNYQL